MPAYEPKYLPTLVNPCMARERINCIFEYYLVETGLSVASDKLRFAAPYLSLGTLDARVCPRLFSDLPTFQEVRDRLTERFGDHKSHIYARAQFHTREQQSAKDVDFYVKELRTLIISCHYNAFFANEVHREHFVAGVLPEKVR